MSWKNDMKATCNMSWKITSMLAQISCHATMNATAHEITRHATSHEGDVMKHMSWNHMIMKTHVMKLHDHENTCHETTWSWKHMSWNFRRESVMNKTGHETTCMTCKRCHSVMIASQLTAQRSQRSLKFSFHSWLRKQQNLSEHTQRSKFVSLSCAVPLQCRQLHRSLVAFGG